MLSFDTGKLLAKVKGGKYNGKVLRIDSSDYRRNVPQELPKNKRSYSKFSRTPEPITSLVLDNGGMFTPLPDEDTRRVVLICGPAGSGKSTYAAEWIRNFQKLFPDKQCFGMSRGELSSDPAFRGLNITQIPVDESIIIKPIDICQELSEGSLMLFDDCTFQNNKFQKTIQDLMIQIMEIGRKLDITCVIVNHLIIDNCKAFSRVLLNECTSLTVFPRSSSIQQIKYALKTYWGYSNKQIDKFINTDSRWVTFCKEYPGVVLTQYEAFIPR